MRLKIYKNNFWQESEQPNEKQLIQRKDKERRMLFSNANKNHIMKLSKQQITITDDTV